MFRRILVLSLLFLLGLFVAGVITADGSVQARCRTTISTIGTTTITVTQTIASTVYSTITSTVVSTVTVTSGGTTTTGTTTTGTTTTPPPPSEPPAIAGQGYRRVFADEFATLDRTVWDDHIWYDEPPHSDWPSFQTAHDGELDLDTRAADLYQGCSLRCYPIDTVTTLTSGRSFQYGYFEARIKWTKGAGSWPAFWLLSTGWANTGSCTTPAGELDVMEGQGTEPNVLYGTIHKDSANACGGDQQNGNNWQPVGVDLTASFHTYAALWTSTTVSWYLDDRLIMSAPTYSTDNQPMFLLLQMWSGGWTSDPNSTTPASLHTEVDWVHVWQK